MLDLSLKRRTPQGPDGVGAPPATRVFRTDLTTARSTSELPVFASVVAGGAPTPSGPCGAAK